MAAVVNERRALLAKLRSSLNGESLSAQILRDGLGSLALKFASIPIGIVSAVVLARVLGVKEYGTYSYVFAIVSLLSIPAQFGLPGLVVRETAKAHAGEQWLRMKSVWRWSTGFVIVCSSALIVLGSLCVCILWGTTDTDQLKTFMWGLVLIPLLALGNLRSSALRGLRKVVLGQLPEKILRPGLLVIIVLGMSLFATTGPLTAADAMSFHALAALLAFISGALILLRERPENINHVTSYEYQHRAWLISVMPMAAASTAQIINTYVDLLVLGVFESKSHVGIYRAAAQGKVLVAFGLQVVNLVAAPYLAKLYAENNMIRLQLLVTRSAQATFLLSFPLAIAFICFGGSFLRIVFGEDYQTGGKALAVLSFGQLAAAAFGTTGYLLTMTGLERIVMRVIICSVLLNSGLNFVFIPYLGMQGAAIATIVSLLTWNLLLCYYAKQQLKINTFMIPTVKD